MKEGRYQGHIVGPTIPPLRMFLQSIIDANEWNGLWFPGSKLFENPSRTISNPEDRSKSQTLMCNIYTFFKPVQNPSKSVTEYLQNCLEFR